jgi:hypothetical protein
MPQTNFTGADMKPSVVYVPYPEPVLPAEFVEDVEKKLETTTSTAKKNTSKKNS